MADDRRQTTEKTIRTGMTDRVRAACKKLDCAEGISRMEVYYEVDPEPGREYVSFERTWQDLIDGGNAHE